MMTGDDILLVADAFKLALYNREKCSGNTLVAGVGWVGGFIAGAIEESNPGFSTEWFVEYCFGKD